jgi:hypothetical protein
MVWDKDVGHFLGDFPDYLSLVEDVQLIILFIDFFFV